MPQKPSNRYLRLLERIFLSRYVKGAQEIVFRREDIARAAEELNLKLPSNVGDVIYSFRY